MSAADLGSAAGSVVSAARELSARHAIVNRRPKPIPVWSKLPSMRQWLDEALAAARLSGPNGAMAAEWLMDNDYHVQRTILQIREDLPERFYRRLPALGGAVVDENALIAVLREGHLGGATLDVFDKEPLPADSPLWQMPNVLITPHRASNPVPEAAARIVAESIRRIGRGVPPLYEVDRKRGY